MPKPRMMRRDLRRVARFEARRAAVDAVLALLEADVPPPFPTEEMAAAYRAEISRLAGLLNYRSKREGRARARIDTLRERRDRPSPSAMQAPA